MPIPRQRSLAFPLQRLELPLSPIRTRRLFCLLALVPLCGCLTSLNSATLDAEAIALAAGIRRDSSEFYAGLAGTPPPHCGYEQNRNTYGLLSRQSTVLEERLAKIGASAALVRAAAALSRTLAEARTSHRLASETSNDMHGVCMAPGAIALNAAAIARATETIGAALGAAGARP